MDRPLDGWERRFWIVGLEATVNVVTVAYLHGPLRPDALRQALGHAQRRHAMLRVHVEDTAEGPRWREEGTPGLVLRTVRRDGAATWREVADRELSERFAAAPGPLLRAMLVEGQEEHELLLTFHHAIGDALAGHALTGELLRSAAGHAPGPALPAPPGPFALLPGWARGVRGRVRFLREGVRAARLLRVTPPRGLPRDAEAPPGERRSRLLHAELHEAQTNSLAARCRAEGATVQGALSAAVLGALADEVGHD
ncbi:MAG: condensation domain-containing protein, partial [Halobacteriales archaeon]|nr:condensation domain-containing protein [Halobacteriales archaeon]